MPAWKPVSRAEVGMETGFHADVGRNADGNNVEKVLKSASGQSWALAVSGYLIFPLFPLLKKI